MAQRRNAAVSRVAKRRYWREAEARVIVEAWQQSRESLAGFARRYGVDGQRITRWASRLTPARPADVGFHPVRLVDTPGQCEQWHAPIEVVLRDGRTVRVPPGCAPADLDVVLRVLEGASGC